VYIKEAYDCLVFGLKVFLKILPHQLSLNPKNQYNFQDILLKNAEVYKELLLSFL
jgi:hypothetical protein